ncbi:EamA family transporter, partial [Bacillus sp. S34]|nr:EamA family transporter [Bacillus sp. S34]
VPQRGSLGIGMLVSALVIMPVGAISMPKLAGDPGLLFPLMGVALLSSVVPYSLELQALKRLPAQVFGILLALEPVVAGIVGWLLLGQKLT